MPTVYIDASEVLDDVTDDELLEEVEARGLTVQAKGKPPNGDTSRLVVDAYEHALGRRRERALAAIQTLIEAYLPPDVLAAYDAARADDWSTAVILLDRVMEPTPAATSADVAKARAAA